MKLKLIQLLGFNRAIEDIAKEKVPLILAYKLAKAKSAINDDVEFYHQRIQQIIELYAERDENGQLHLVNDNNGIKIQEDKIPECNEKIKELEGMMVDAPDVKFSLEELSTINITVSSMELLLPFITE